MPGLTATEWNTPCTGGGGLLRTDGGLRFVNPPLDGSAGQDAYCNAQLDDYQRLPRRLFRHRPPLRLTVRARFSHPAGRLSGTAGFGFWNDPFLMSGAAAGRRLPRLPRALWFFYAGPPADLRLAVATPGCGWKAAALDATQARAAASLPLAALLAPALRSERLYRRLWPAFERRFGIAERLLAAPLPAAPPAAGAGGLDISAGLDSSGGLDITQWHEYAIDWQPDRAVFWVDGRAILTAPLRRSAAAVPLGFVAWLDNQSLVLHPSGRLRWGVVTKSETQWMELGEIRL